MTFIKAEDAVSETLGFALLVFILTTAMAAVLMIGYPIYQGEVTKGHMQNMEEGFYLLSANANKVAMYESPSQSSELKLYGGTLMLRDLGYFNVSFEYGIGMPTKYAYFNQTLNTLEYESGNTRLAYFLGGVCRKDGATSIMLKEPSIYGYDTFNTKTLVISMVEIDNSMEALAGTGPIRITFNSPFYSKMVGTLLYPSANRTEQVTKVTIRMKSDYNDCFERYFRDRYGFDGGPDANGVLVMQKTYLPGITLYLVPNRISVNMN